MCIEKFIRKWFFNIMPLGMVVYIAQKHMKACDSIKDLNFVRIYSSDDPNCYGAVVLIRKQTSKEVK